MVRVPSGRVCLVDDNDVFRRLLKRILEECGFTVEALGCAQDAVAFLRAEPPYLGRPRPDFILLDYELDAGNDARVLLGESKRSSELRDIPVLVMSQGDHAAESLAAGARRFLRKPSDVGELQQAGVSFSKEAVMKSQVLLLIDDEQLDTRMMKGQLEEDFEVRWATSPDAGLGELERQHVDVVVMDYQFGSEITGPEYVRRIRKKWPTLPIIVVSRHATLDNMHDAFKELGACDLVRKQLLDWPHQVRREVLKVLTNLFHRENESVWRLRFGGRQASIAGTIGFFHLQQLIRHVYRDFAPEELLALLPCAAAQSDLVATDYGESRLGGDPVLDARAFAEAGERLRELAADRQEAERQGSFEWLERIDGETASIKKELCSASNPCNRVAKVLDPARDNRRINVRRNIITAIERIERCCQPLGEHLRRYVRFGHIVAYRPYPPSSVRWCVDD